MTGRPVEDAPADAEAGVVAPAASGSLTRRWLVGGLGLVLPLFVLVEVNYPLLSPQSQLALFALCGLALCFLNGGASGLRAASPGGAEGRAKAPGRRGDAGWRRWLDLLLALAAIAVCAYVVVQTEPLFSGLWLGGTPLGERAGAEARLDVVVGVLGTLVVLEAARRSIGLALPVLALAFLAYAALGPQLPAWLLPHRGYGLSRIVSQGFLHSQGVFGVALKVMFAYVFLFVVFGAVLEATGATGFVIRAVRRLFRNSPGGPAKVAVLSSGLMGSLSGSAVANTATTGTFTIPMMRSAGFKPRVAAGLEAAASSGGALVPPVMGAGAYMMLEIVEPPVTYLEIVRAALIPAILYYLSLYLIVHWGSRRLASDGGEPVEEVAPEMRAARTFWRWEGLLFVIGLTGLVACLVAGFSVFRSVTVALAGVLLAGLAHRRTRLGPRRLLDALTSASQAGVPLIAAAACVGIVIGIVTLTGVGSRLPALLIPLAQEHLLLALVAIMVSSIVLGMGLPSAVCYLLMATLIGPVLGKLGVVPLAAHLFIFYFGMMSMVTPPVALAAYAASAIAGSRFFETGLAAFRFALAGFALPFLFVLRPQLLLLAPGGGPAAAGSVAMAVALAVIGIVPLAAAVAGHLLRRSTALERGLQLLASLLILAPAGARESAAPTLVNAAGLVLLVALVAWQRRTPEAATRS